MNIEKIKEHADKLALETGKRIQVTYNKHAGVQYYPASVRRSECFELLYVTE
jgi:hypothetical protein